MNLATWLKAALDLCCLSEESCEYLMGRGATRELLDRWGIKTFESPPDPCPDPSFHKHYGERFERFEGKIIFPLYSPRGTLLGIDSRTAYRKDEDRFLFPESRWNPVWIGMPDAMEAIWEGRDIIVVEGRYDLFAMIHAITRNQALLGSGPAHLSWKQLEFLRRWARGDVYIAYDRDDAGRKGTVEALENLNYCRVKCSEIRYGRNGDDPGTIWDQGGVSALREVFPHL